VDGTLVVRLPHAQRGGRFCGVLQMPTQAFCSVGWIPPSTPCVPPSARHHVADFGGGPSSASSAAVRSPGDALADRTHNSWLTNFGQLRRNTDGRTHHRLAQLGLAIVFL
jgi:hypothetical protein